MDFALVTQALVNVVENAIKYSPADAPVDIRAQVAGDEVQIQIEDRGTGIPPGDLRRIFDKFYRIQREEAPGGVGLGLAISKGIIEAHGGRIWAENRPGGGTTVVVTLPLASPARMPASDGPTAWAMTDRAS
jgi:two-component system sensor histidine kinase KdpD